MWELDHEESWVQKNCAFELWCWRRPLRVPWTARRSKQSILKEISPGCSLEGLMLKLKLDAKNWFIWKYPDAGKEWRWEKGMTEDEMAGWPSPTQWTWVWVNSGSWWWTGRPGVLQSMSCIESHTTEELNRTTEEAGNHRSLLTQKFYLMSQFRGRSLVGSHWSPRGCQETSPTPQFKSIYSSALSFLYSPTLTSIHDYWKNNTFEEMDLFLAK